MHGGFKAATNRGAQGQKSQFTPLGHQFLVKNDFLGIICSPFLPEFLLILYVRHAQSQNQYIKFNFNAWGVQGHDKSWCPRAKITVYHHLGAGSIIFG